MLEFTLGRASFGSSIIIFMAPAGTMASDWGLRDLEEEEADFLCGHWVKDLGCYKKNPSLDHLVPIQL